MRIGKAWTGVVLAAALGCGGAGGGGGGCTPGQTAAVTVAATGFQPRAVCVLPGGTITFTNGDAVPHSIQADATCPELSVGPIAAGQRDSATLPTAALCTFVDAAHPSDPAFQGTVAVTTGTASGPGY